MRLGKKMALVCTSVLITVVTTCCILFALQTKESMLNLAEEYAKQKQANLQKSFSEMMNYYSLKNDSDELNFSLAYYCFSRFSDDEAVLIRDSGVVYSKLEINPQRFYVQNKDKQFINHERIDGNPLILIGDQISINDSNYEIYIVQNISWVYDNIRENLSYIIPISVSSIILGLIIIILYIRGALTPLENLRVVAKRITLGDFSERANIITTDEIGQLASDFNTMAAHIEQKVAELTDIAMRQRLFIGGVVHEFKTPLATMLLHADALENICLNNAEREKSLECITNQCIWLEKLRRKLLSLIVVQDEIKKRPV
ncbi:MAG: HAMP domain-containing protein, partial [Christensenellaceae bacterium]